MFLIHISLTLLPFVLIVHTEFNTHDLCDKCSCYIDRTVVDCSQQGLLNIPEGNGEKVQKLNVSNNEITSFPKNLSRFFNLNTLDLSNNLLNYIPEDALNNLTTLEVLNLSQNRFEVWINLNPNEILKRVENLKILDLSLNNFKTLGNLANQELIVSSSLETLILENCQINSIHGRSPLSGLSNLRVLKLNFNPLRRIQNLVSPTLRSLQVSNCQLSVINYNELRFLPSLIHLKMSHNSRLEFSPSGYSLISDSLKFFDISYCNIMQPTLNGFPNLKKAIINHNMIRYLKSNAFINNSKLEYLDLSYNNIGSVKFDSFKGLKLLNYLDLSWNEIAVIPENTLIQMPSLIQINLSRNYLTKLGYLQSTSLTSIDMSSCEINDIGKDSLEGFSTIVALNLAQNLISFIPDGISSSTLQNLNLNYNRISAINNRTFFMLPRLTTLSVIGNRFTSIWSKSYFHSNPYLERLDLTDNMWRCDCADKNTFDFYDFVTLEPNKKEESSNLICNSPSNTFGQTWLEACYFIWNSSDKHPKAENITWFVLIMILGSAVCFLIVNSVNKSMNRRMERLQAERDLQVQEARERLRELRMRAEQQAMCNAPDPRDLISPPSYYEALSMPKLTTSSSSLSEGTGKIKRKRGRRKTKSSSDLLDEVIQNNNIHASDDLQLADTTCENHGMLNADRRFQKYGSHEISELDHSPGMRRRLVSENAENSTQNVTVHVEADLENHRAHKYQTSNEISSEEELVESNL